MRLESLYARSASHGNLYAFLLVNRIQILYVFLIIPAYLIEPYMIWAILGVGLVSQVVLLALSRWFTSVYSDTGYEWFVRTFGTTTVRWLAGFGLVFLFVKLSIITLGAVEIAQQFIFPSMSPYILMAFIFLAGCYLAAHGMENLVRLVVIIFLGSFWILLMFIPYLFPPFASLFDLYPLIPTTWNLDMGMKLLHLFGIMSGPEYLVLLAPWVKPVAQRFPIWTLGNALTVFEYVLLFITSLLFYGPDYLGKTLHPILNMIRYQQTPIVERVDVILISTHLINMIYFIAVFLLFIYGAFRTIAGQTKNKIFPLGFWICSGFVLILLFAAYKWLWEVGKINNVLITLQLWLGSLSFAGVPLLLLLAIKRKGRISG